MPSFGAPNPFVLAVLRSRMHRVLGGALLTLTVRGRKTGREHVFPVMYARDGQNLVVVAAWASKKRWWRNLRGGAEVKVLLGGEPLRGRGTLVDDGVERGRLLRLYLERFPTAASTLGLPRDRSAVDDATLSRQLRNAEVVHIALEEDAP